MSKFTHLHVHSHYSLLDGLAKIDDLVSRAQELKMKSLALTDHGNLYGAVEFYKKAKAGGIKPILGVEVYVAPYGMLNKRPKIDEQRYHLTLLAENLTGWKNVIQLVTQSYLDGFYYKPRIDKELLAKYADGIICLSGCVSGELSKLIASNKQVEAEQLVVWYQKVFGDRFFIEVQPHAKELHEKLHALGKKFNVPLVGTQDAHYVRREDQMAHEILLAIQTASRLDDEDRLTLKKYDISLCSEEEMQKHFAHMPEVLDTAHVIAERCNVEIALGEMHMPVFPVPDGTNENDYLRLLVQERLPQRIQVITEEVASRVEQELEVITKTGFANYFLIVQDFINWAKNHGIVVGPGRGSAAGSIISFILGITNINPITYDLLFERFLNPDRIAFPDIDIDFTDIRRDEVVAYVRQKYGEDHVAQIITFGTMMARAAIRDTGRALGLAYSLCDKIAKLIPLNTSIDGALQAVPELKREYANNVEVKRLLESAKKLEGVARHASVHACGIVMSSEPLTDIVPLQRAPQGDTSIITQFEMHSIEDLGLLKMDFLGLKNLTIIEKTLHLIADIRGVVLEIDNLPLDDEKTFEILKKGNTTGVFQLESSGMRGYLKELKPTELEDVIAMISLYRPGPMELIPHYIRRKFKKEAITYLHPLLKPILKKTYGVGIYQEQMMQIARDLGGFTLAQADTLRKAIGKKIKKLLDEQKGQLIKGMVANGIDEKTAHAIWELFPPFARYGFNRSHAASYAMISYQTAYLKAHYPVEFMTSLLNISTSDIDRITFLVAEARRSGIEVLAPDINLSYQDFTVDGNNIRFGLLAVKNVGANIINAMIEERTSNGPFTNLSDFLTRLQHRDLNKKSLESFIKCGVFDSFGIEREQGLESIDDLLTYNQAAKKMKLSNQTSLFGSASSISSIKLRPAPPADRALRLSWEKELLGLYLTDHPFNIYYEKVKQHVKPIKEIINQKSQPDSNARGPRMKLAGIISGIQRITTKKGDPMLFVKLEDLSDNLEVLVFSDTLAKTPLVWQENKAIMVAGRLSYRNGEPKLICDGVREL